MRTLTALSATAPFVTVLAAWFATTSADAAVTVIGNSSARLCYEAARSPSRSLAAIRFCDAAFETEALTQDDEVATHVNRGILRATGGNIAAAIADYDAALALDPDEPEAWLNKGFATLRNGDAAGSLPFSMPPSPSGRSNLRWRITAGASRTNRQAICARPMPTMSAPAT